MEFSEVALNRRMTRDFSPKKVPRETIVAVSKLALTSPTAGNCRGVEMLILSEEHPLAVFWASSTTKQWREKGGKSGVKRSPVIVIPLYCTEKYLKRYAMDDKANSALYKKTADRWEVPFWITDVSFAVMTLLLAAQNCGLGALFFQLHRPPRKVLDSLGVPEGYGTIGAVALGYADADPPTGLPPNGPDAWILPPGNDARIHIDSW